MARAVHLLLQEVDMLPGSLSLLGLVSCWQEHAWRQRVWEMQEHEEDCLMARDALLQQDLPTARRAGQGLSLPDPVPLLPETARVHLDAVRAGGQRLAAAESLESAASTLMAVTERCAACHQSLGVLPPPAQQRALEDLWTALLFEDEGRWSLGLGLQEAPDPALAEAQGWNQRRAAMERWLREGTSP
jgi:mono/diheme cytochrome c family protein